MFFTKHSIFFLRRSFSHGQPAAPAPRARYRRRSTTKQTMIFITQLIYLKEGQETIFHQFEDIAIPIIAKYNGRLLLRVRPGICLFRSSGLASSMV